MIQTLKPNVVPYGIQQTINLQNTENWQGIICNQFSWIVHKYWTQKTLLLMEILCKTFSVGMILNIKCCFK